MGRPQELAHEASNGRISKPTPATIVSVVKGQQEPIPLREAKRSQAFQMASEREKS